MHEELLKRVGRTIRTLREAERLSQERFAQLVGIERAYYGRIERGTANVTLLTLFRIAGELGADPKALLDGITFDDLATTK